jgi:biopolymer transport protein ExbD
MRFRRPLHEEPEVNLIPLIDVLLIVLIFLAVSTTYSRFAELKIELPAADATTPAVRTNEINVAVTADGRYAIDRKLIGAPDVREFARVLQKAAQGKEAPLLVVNADAQAPHQSVISVMEAARLAGIVRISFATQRASGAGR